MIRILTVTTLAMTIFAGFSHADSVEVFERGRNNLVANLVDPDLDPHKRLEKLSVLKRDQMNLEKIVARDSSLKGKNAGRNVRLFNDFETNFLVHAAHESGKTLSEHWFYLIGLSSESLSNANVGRR